MTEIRLSEEEYYRRAYGAWLGKNVGGTLGEPVEGHKERLDLEFYPELPSEFDTTDIARYPDATDEGEPTPLANDDLDLQLIWLHALEQYGAGLRATELTREWVDHVFFPYNENRTRWRTCAGRSTRRCRGGSTTNSTTTAWARRSGLRSRRSSCPQPRRRRPPRPARTRSSTTSAERGSTKNGSTPPSRARRSSRTTFTG